MGRFCLKLSSWGLLGRKAGILLGVAVLGCYLSSPATAAPPTPQISLPGMQYAQITNAMGTAAVSILGGINQTVCAAGCTFTSAPAGAPVPQVFYGAMNSCSTAATGNVSIFDAFTSGGTPVYLTGPFGAGQIITEPAGGVQIVTDLTITLSVAEPALPCTFVVFFR